MLEGQQMWEYPLQMRLSKLKMTFEAYQPEGLTLMQFQPLNSQSLYEAYYGALTRYVNNQTDFVQDL